MRGLSLVSRGRRSFRSRSMVVVVASKSTRSAPGSWSVLTLQRSSPHLVVAGVGEVDAAGQPVDVFAGTVGQLSVESETPSASLSGAAVGQPLGAVPAWVGQASLESGTPSPSVSAGGGAADPAAWQ